MSLLSWWQQSEENFQIFSGVKRNLEYNKERVHVIKISLTLMKKFVSIIVECL